MPAKILIPLIASLGLFATADAQEPGPRFTIETAELPRSGCAMIALNDAGAAEVEIAQTRVKLPQFVEIRQEGRKLPPLLTGNFVSLTNGDRLPLEPEASATLQASRLHVWPAKSLGFVQGKALDLFAPNVVLLFWSLPEGVDDAGRFFALLQDESRKRDAVYLQNGDRIEGTVTALGAKIGCVLSSDGRKVQTPWSKLAGIAFNTDRQARLKTKKTHARAVLDGGARINFLELRFEEKTRQWIGKTQFGTVLELPETTVLAMDSRQGQAVDLSELTPTRYEHRPYLGAAWPLMKDSAVSGQALRLNGSTYEKGLGTHAACRVIYKLDGQYQRFDAVVGIDETFARRGRAKVAIELDGKRIDLNDGKELTSQTAPLVVRVDVRKATSMTLIVELGSFGDVQAHVNWAKARLIKADVK
jgi:NPCBM/NEW2 domain